MVHVHFSYYSFGLATETKSGRLVCTPGKFSTCVSGKRKIHKTRNLSSTMESTFTESTFMDNTSMVVNTSQNMDTEETVEEAEIVSNLQITENNVSSEETTEISPMYVCCS